MNTVESKCFAPQLAKATLQKYFGFSNFHPGQLEAVMAVLHRQDVFLAVSPSASVGHSPLEVGHFVGGRHEHLESQYLLATLQCQTMGRSIVATSLHNRPRKRSPYCTRKDLRRYCFVRKIERNTRMDVPKLCKFNLWTQGVALTIKGPASDQRVGEWTSLPTLN